MADSDVSFSKSFVLAVLVSEMRQAISNAHIGEQGVFYRFGHEEICDIFDRGDIVS